MKGVIIISKTKIHYLNFYDKQVLRANCTRTCDSLAGALISKDWLWPWQKKNRNEGTGVRVRHVSCGCSLEAGKGVRFGKSSSLLLCDATSKRATLSVCFDFTFLLHRHPSVFRHNICQELVQMGWLRWRRQVSVADGQKVPPGRDASWYRRDSQVYARCEYAQQQGGSKGN